jgi:polyhydroxybutyrate depolymerase
MRRSIHRVIVALLIALHGCHGDAPPRQPRTGPFASGDHDRTLVVGDRTRHYILHVPPQAHAGRALPLVISFHGGGGHAESQQRYSRLDRVADREGFVTVYPEGSGGVGRRLLTWNAGSCCGPAMREQVDDVGFVRALIDEIARLLPIDRARVYATGLSNGAMMAYRLAAEAPDLIAAIAPVAGAGDVHPRSGARAVPVMHIHSKDDPRALYAGGLGPPFPLTRHRVMHVPVESVVQRWVDHDGCAKTPRTDAARHAQGHSATRLTWSACPDGGEVVLWRLTGAGHVWPGGQRDFLVRLLGPGTSVIDANQEIWGFFRRFSLH